MFKRKSENEDEEEYENASANSSFVSSTTHSGLDDDDESESPNLFGSQMKFAQRETFKVSLWKSIVLFMLFINAAIVAIMSYALLLRSEENTFVAGFEESAKIVSQAISHHSMNLFDGFESISDLAITVADASRSQWPFVTIPDFELYASQLRSRSFVDTIAFCPIVQQDLKKKWEEYSFNYQGWIADSLAIDQHHPQHLQSSVQTLEKEDNTTMSPERARAEVLQNWKREISPTIFYVENGQTKEQNSSGPYAPIWQISRPPYQPQTINYDLLSTPFHNLLYEQITRDNRLVFSEMVGTDSLFDREAFQDGKSNIVEAEVDASAATSDSANNTLLIPQTTLFHPIMDRLGDREITAIMAGLITWDVYLAQLIPAEDIYNGIYLVLRNSCGQVLTYRVVENEVLFQGEGDFHEPDFERIGLTINLLSTSSSLSPFVLHEGAEDENRTSAAGYCNYTLSMFPSEEMYDSFRSANPGIVVFIFLAIFAVTFASFAIFVRFIRQRQDKVMALAVRTNNVVSAMFPSNVRGRILKEVEERAKRDTEGKGLLEIPKSQLKNFLADEEAIDEDDHRMNLKTKPIADLFPGATVSFADIVGFTAWSSVREPSQVFELLETIYHEFDMIAKRRRVFKVETVGDCYVAVAGLPEARKDHAVVMARFAKDCLDAMHSTTKQLEVVLGPDTGDLSMRFGLHSGPVTAGVLRGERARFQLFGDTVNTGARMESTGMRDRIHISQETADLLIHAGKEHWCVPREEKIVAKGKGELQTYWLVMGSRGGQSGSGVSDRSDSNGLDESDNGGHHARHNENNEESESTLEIAGVPISDKHQRLIDWNSEQLLRLLKQIVARRLSIGREETAPNPAALPVIRELRSSVHGGTLTVLDEVKEVVALPKFDPQATKRRVDPMAVELDPTAVAQLRAFVSAIYTMYRHNSFHNFEHASHVTMSVMKLLSRIVTPDEINYNKESMPTSEAQRIAITSNILHDYSYGITSDPLTQFAVVLSALIHDVDHTGVPNAQLIEEQSELAVLYRERSVAEQNSVDLAWDLLMEPQFVDLRSVICYNEEEMKRFRQIVINTVMATDIADKDLKLLRNNRWDKAFSDEQLEKEDAQVNVNRKATIVIEHLIQASDVAHTMQHWHVYRKWNERLFREMHHAFKVGRAKKDPTEFWYKGEIGFFDFYIIPLAKKLKECGVFGVFSDDYLSYAVANRAEWTSKGEEIIREMVAALPPDEEELENYSEEKKVV